MVHELATLSAWVVVWELVFVIWVFAAIRGG